MDEESIKLEGVVNIAKAETLFHDMERIAKHCMPTKIYAAKVTRIDTAAIQLIASFMQYMHQAEVTVEWCGVSDDFMVAARLLGMEQALNLKT